MSKKERIEMTAKEAVNDLDMAALWDLCKGFDEEYGLDPKVGYTGIALFEYYVKLLKANKMSHITSAVKAMTEVVLEEK